MCPKSARLRWTSKPIDFLFDFHTVVLMLYLVAYHMEVYKHRYESRVQVRSCLLLRWRKLHCCSLVWRGFTFDHF
ncbi:hypothetical protein CH063_11963, partial [Colletotrichum higginsianum]